VTAARPRNTRSASSPFIVAERGCIDDVLMPHSTRKRIAQAPAMLRGKQVEMPKQA
jgi:propionyl-CoA carboxylase beta chain